MIPSSEMVFANNSNSIDPLMVSPANPIADRFQTLGLFSSDTDTVDPTKPPDYYKTFKEIVEENGFHY